MNLQMYGTGKFQIMNFLFKFEPPPKKNQRRTPCTDILLYNTTNIKHRKGTQKV